MKRKLTCLNGLLSVKRTALAGAILALLPGFLFPIAPANASLFGVSEKQELGYGRQADDSIQKQMSVDHDKALNDWVDRIGAQLTPYTDRPNLQYTFRVINDKAVNAFSVPGYVYVQTGLLEFIKDDPNKDDELAGVMAHELGHTGGRHIAKEIAQQEEASIGANLLSVITKGVYDQAISIGADLSQLGHSRGCEYDADHRAVNTLMRAGIDPQGLVDFFVKLKAKYKDGSRFEEYFETHPMTGDRIQKVQEEIAYDKLHGPPPPKPG